MDRKSFRKAYAFKSKQLEEEKHAKSNTVGMIPEGQNLAVLRELGNQLQIKAEKMRLLARAEEGLGDGEINPYEPCRRPVESIMHIDRSAMKEKKDEGFREDAPSSLSLARQRRRDKKTRTKGTASTKIDIRQYRPGYTWNRGGRVKELRIRTLARKFLLIWKSKVFGRVTPSEARHHYKRRLLKLTFRAWHGMWWELRKEWRLEVRAECHHRFVLWQKTFRAWRDFIVKQRIKNTKNALAEQHSSCKLTRKVLNAWITYTHERRGKRMEKQKAEEFHNRVLLRQCWDHWESQHELVLHRQQLETVALQFWAYRIQAQHWLIWHDRLMRRRASIQYQFRAVRHYDTSVVQRCFKAWISYWARRRQKKQEKEYAFQIYNRHMLRKTFGVWIDMYQHKQAVQVQHEHIEDLAMRFQKRRAFLHWRHYIEQVREKQENTALAEAHYERKLKMTGLSAFRLCVVQRKLKLMREELAADLRNKQLSCRAWNGWMSRCESNEELKIIAQSQRAKKHYRHVLLQKCFDQLQRYCYWRQYRQSQYAKADAHFYMRIMPECLYRLRVFVQLMKDKRENDEKAADFRRENLHARFFYLWVTSAEQSRENRMNERMAILHNEDTVIKRHFMKWKTRTIEVLKGHENEEAANEHYNEVLRKKHLKAWHQYILDIKNSQRQDIQASVHHHKTVLRRCLTSWRIYSKQRVLKKAKTGRARQHYHKVLSKKMMSMWLHYIDTQRCIKQRVEVMYARKCQQKLSEAFLMWRENVLEQVQDRIKGEQGSEHHSRHLLSKVFQAWHRFSAIHAYKKSETKQWVLNAKDYLNQKTLSVYFNKWKDYHSEHVAMKMKLQVAVDHHGNKVKLKVIQAWRCFTQDSVKKVLLRKQSDWFFKVRVTARCFIRWKAEYAAAQLEKEKTHLALWNWCLCLQRKVFTGWMEYIQERKRKKQQVAEAMERRRCRLIKGGLTQWLTVADDLAALRKTFAAQQQAQSAYKTYQLVLRCGLHWKHWAMKQRQTRGGLKPLPSSVPSRQPPQAKGSYSGQQLYTVGCSALAPNVKTDNFLRATPRDEMLGNITNNANAGSSKVTPRDKSVTPRDVTVIPKPTVVTSPAHSTCSIQSTGEPRRRTQLRARPRKPDFLVESLKRAGLYSPMATSHEKVVSNISPDNNQTGHDQELVLERLDLTALHTDRSDLTTASEVPFQTYGSAGRVSQPVSTRSEPLKAPIGKNGYPKTDNLVSGFIHKDLDDMSHEKVGPPDHDNCVSVQFGAPPSNRTNEKGKQFKTDVNINSQQSCDNAYLSKGDNKIRLMTPADFLQTKSQNVPLQTSAKSDIDVNIPNECQSVVSTPRILCQTSGHHHPLSETRSFQVGDGVGEITPRSVSSCVTPREQLHSHLSSLGFESKKSSNQSIQQEIILIRNKLKSFDQKKKKLKTMQKQLKHLSHWLRDTEVKGHRSDDEDVRNARQEVTKLSADVDSLRLSVEEEKLACAALVERVQHLRNQLVP